jgi:hypothetical protein
MIVREATLDDTGDIVAVHTTNPDRPFDRPEYLAVLNGIGKEETYYYGMGQPIPWRDRLYTEALLGRFKGAGYSGLVLTVDYTLRRLQVDLAYRRATAKGYVEYCTHVNLDRMVIYPGHEPICY